MKGAYITTEISVAVICLVSCYTGIYHICVLKEAKATQRTLGYPRVRIFILYIEIYTIIYRDISCVRIFTLYICIYVYMLG